MKGNKKSDGSSTNSTVGGRLVVINSQSLDSIVLPQGSISTESSVAVSSIQSVVCRQLLLYRSVGMRVAESDEPLGLLRTAGSGGDVGVTTREFLDGVSCLRLWSCLVIHQK